MRCKGPRGRTARYGVKHWRLNLHKTLGIKERAHESDDFRANLKGLSDFGISDKVNVTLTITRLLIRQTMIFIRQGTECFGQEVSGFHIDV